VTTENRVTVSSPGMVTALAHPVRLAVMTYLLADGPATASRCARIVGDTPSNCSYHLRMLARHGLVGECPSADGRERPWRALVTGLRTDAILADPPDRDGPDGTTLLAVAVQNDVRMQQEYLQRRHRVPPPWRKAGQHSTYTLLLTPEELADLTVELDALIRPYLAPTREEPDDPADEPNRGLVHLGLHAFLIGQEP
jgi:Helix-turn-helix domain